MSTGLPDFASVSLLAVDPLVSTTVYAVVDSSLAPLDLIPIGVFKSTDSGQNWTPINTGLANGLPVTAVALDPIDPLTVYACNPGSLFNRTYAQWP